MKKHLSESEIRSMLKAHFQESPEPAVTEGESRQPRRCDQCQSLLAPYLNHGAVRYGCFTCDDITPG